MNNENTVVVCQCGQVPRVGNATGKFNGTQTDVLAFWNDELENIIQDYVK